MVEHDWDIWDRREANMVESEWAKGMDKGELYISLCSVLRGGEKIMEDPVGHFMESESILNKIGGHFSFLSMEMTGYDFHSQSIILATIRIKV